MPKAIFDRDEAVEMYLNGSSPETVAKYYNVDGTTFRSELKKRGINLRPRSFYRNWEQRTPTDEYIGERSESL